MIVDRMCWERGCACYDQRVDKEPVEIPDREWVGLTDEEIKVIWSWEVGKSGYNNHELPWRYARAIEAKLKEKNT